MNKAIRTDYKTKSVYYVELDISTYDKKIESVKKELNSNDLLMHYLPSGEIVFMDEEYYLSLEDESNRYCNVLIVGNSVEDVSLSAEYIKELLLPNIYQFSNEMQ